MHSLIDNFTQQQHTKLEKWIEQTSDEAITMLSNKYKKLQQEPPSDQDLVLLWENKTAEEDCSMQSELDQNIKDIVSDGLHISETESEIHTAVETVKKLISSRYKNTMQKLLASIEQKQTETPSNSTSRLSI